MTFMGGLAGFAVDAMARPAILHRPREGAYVNGQWVPGWDAPCAIRAVIQGPTERDIRQLPEGERTESYVTIWTRAVLKTSDEDDAAQADIVESENGQQFKITRVVERTEAGFTRAIARLTHDRGRRV